MLEGAHVPEKIYVKLMVARYSFFLFRRQEYDLCHGLDDSRVLTEGHSIDFAYLSHKYNELRVAIIYYFRIDAVERIHCER